MSHRSITSISFVPALLAIIFLALPHYAFASAVSLTEATSSSNNASTTLAKVGDTVSFQLNLSAGGGTATSTPVINIFNMGSTTMVANGNYTSTSTATLWTYATTSVSAWTEGNIAFTIGYPNDTNAIATSTFSSTASSTFVQIKFDNTPPTVTAASVSSSNASTTIAKPGDILTLAFMTNEAIQTPSEVIIYGHDATMLPTDSTRTSWTASSSVLTGNTSGQINFAIVTPTDMAGNATSTNTGPASPGVFNTYLTGANVFAYEDAPTITIAGSNPDSVSASASQSYTDPGATAVDALNAPVSVVVSGSVDRTKAGTYTLTYTATDPAGNQRSSTRTVTVTGSSGGSGGGGASGGFINPNGNAYLHANPNASFLRNASSTLMSSADRESLIASLKAKLLALLTQLMALRGGSSHGNLHTLNATFMRDLQTGVSGDDVLSLQQYLNNHGFPVAATGPGSSGYETKVFGKATRDALAKFQASVGISPATGNFGPKTRAYIAAHP